jgi:hypothetical protein
MHYVLAIIGIITSIALMHYRQQCGDFLGEADWMYYVGGVYNFIVICGILVLFWSLASLFGITDILFAPILYLIPGPTRSSGGGDSMMVQ